MNAARILAKMATGSSAAWQQVKCAHGDLEITSLVHRAWVTVQDAGVSA